MHFITVVCERLPTIKDGSVKKSSSGRAIVTCDPGFVLDGNSSITCLDDIWNENPTCEPVKCGPYPLVENGFVNGSDRLFMSAANVTCNSGFLVDGPSTVSCLENGSWSFVSGCREHPCGMYTPSDDMVAVDTLLLTTVTLCLQCKPGLRFVPDSARCVTCESGRWQGSPKCEIPGHTLIYF